MGRKLGYPLECTQLGYPLECTLRERTSLPDGTPKAREQWFLFADAYLPGDRSLAVPARALDAAGRQALLTVGPTAKRAQ